MSRRRIAAALATCGVLLAAPHALPAQAAVPASGGASALAAARPPAGKAWLTGIITDQAGHTLNDVNVEAWRVDGDQPELVASSRTYESTRKDGQNGFFNLEVPIHASYQVLISVDQGQEDDDAFRMQTYVAPNGNDELKVGLRKERDLGTTEIARQAAQPSRTKARVSPAKVKAGKKAKVTVTVTCTNVDPVTGKVVAVVGHKKVSGTLKATSHGRVTLTLPKLKKPGKYTVKATYLGNDVVKKSSAKVKLTVKK